MAKSSSNVWKSHDFKQLDLKAKLRVTTLQEHAKKLIALVLIVIKTIVRLFLKQGDISYIFALVRKRDQA